jgi:hypothetical protein
MGPVTKIKCNGKGQQQFTWSVSRGLKESYFSAFQWRYYVQDDYNLAITDLKNEFTERAENKEFVSDNRDNT